MLHRSALIVLAVAAFGVMPARADTLEVTFVAYPGQVPGPGVTASFSLNPDGTIAAQASSLGGPLFQFGMHIPAHAQVLNHGFSAPAQHVDYMSSWLGRFDSGWSAIDTQYTSPTTVSWTVGTPGMFSSVAGAFSDNAAGYALFAYALNGVTPGSGITQWGWGSGLVPPPVPEPGAIWLTLAGLMAVVARVRRKTH